MPKGSDNPFPSMLIVEGSTPSSPSAGDQRLFIDSSSHHLKRVNSSGTVADIEGGGVTSVSARALKDSSQSFTGGAMAIINYDHVDFDASSAITTGASWKFTAPVTGTYRVSFAMLSSVSVSGGVEVYLLLNGTGSGQIVTVLERQTSAAAMGTRFFIKGSTTIKLTAGDFISVSLTPDNTISAYAPGGGGGYVYNYIDIELCN